TEQGALICHDKTPGKSGKEGRFTQPSSGIDIDPGKFDAETLLNGGAVAGVTQQGRAGTGRKLAIKERLQLGLRLLRRRCGAYLVASGFALAGGLGDHFGKGVGARRALGDIVPSVSY